MDAARGLDMRRSIYIPILAAALFGSGCETTRRAGEAERFGKTFYLDGAGNWGFGSAEVPQGLKEAGYEGDVEIYVWTTSLSPLIDQLNTPAARLRANKLAEHIEEYVRKYPSNRLNIIALSAGTGVATWAIERLPADAKINNLVLLGSSLSHDYDMSRALSRMTGRIFVYHSPHDLVLAGVRVVGTIDGKRGVDSVGLVGLKPPPGKSDRVVNVGWSRKYIPYGWTGSHTDCTTKKFVREVIARHIVGEKPGSRLSEAGAGSSRTNVGNTRR
jgi:hypothetical protein